MSDTNPYQAPRADTSLEEARDAPPLPLGQMRYAGFARRAPARLLDGALMMLVVFAVQVGSLFLLGEVGQQTTVVMALLVLIGAVYTIGLHGMNGQTLGKMATGIQVRLVDGARMTYKRAFLRYSVELALGLVSAVLLYLAGPSQVEQAAEPPTNVGQALTGLWFIAEVIVFLGNAKSRALHDFVGGTVVVEKVAIGASAPKDETEDAAGHAEAAQQENAADDRVLCPDGACVGVLGADGRCKVCGATAPDGQTIQA